MFHQKALVTGATGLLGSNIAAALLQRGYEVRVLLRKSSNQIALQGLDVEPFFGDIINAEAVSAAVQGCDLVIHAAANTSQWGPEMHLHNAINIQGTQHVLDAVKRWSVPRFVYVSTANTFKPGTRARPGDETNAFPHTELRTDYMDTKNKAQQLVLDTVQNEGVPAVIVNPTFMIGARDAKPSSGKMVLYYLKTPVVVCPPGGKNFVSVRDVAVGAVNAAERGRIGECYLLAGENLNYHEFFTKIGEVSGQKKRIFIASAGLLQTAGRAGDALSKLIGKRIPLSYTNTSLLTIDNYYTPKKAVAELAMPQSPIETAIAEAVHWFKENSYF